jgi:hypothetical protein
MTEGLTYERAVEVLVQGGKIEKNEGRWVCFAMGEARRAMREVG